MKIIILAAGKQARWETEPRFPMNIIGKIKRKQLLPVTGVSGTETILHRIIRQCRQRGEEPTLVTVHADLMDAVDCDIHIPDQCRWTVETLFYSIPSGKGRKIVLLGDTIYSRTVMDRIFACTDPIRVFGNEYEIYAISFDDAKVGRKVDDALATAIDHAEYQRGPGKLRKFYQAYCNLDLDSNQMETTILSRVCYIQDYTYDIDTRKNYKAYIRHVIKGNLLDDENDK